MAASDAVGHVAWKNGYVIGGSNVGHLLISWPGAAITRLFFQAAAAAPCSFDDGPADGTATQLQQRIFDGYDPSRDGRGVSRMVPPTP